MSNGRNCLTRCGLFAAGTGQCISGSVCTIVAIKLAIASFCCDGALGKPALELSGSLCDSASENCKAALSCNNSENNSQNHFQPPPYQSMGIR